MVDGLANVKRLILTFNRLIPESVVAFAISLVSLNLHMLPKTLNYRFIRYRLLVNVS